MCWRIPITSLQGIPLSLSKKSFVPLNMTVFRLVLFYDKKEHKYKRDEKTNKLEFSDEMTIRKQTYNDIIIIIELMQGSKVAGFRGLPIVYHKHNSSHSDGRKYSFRICTKQGNNL